MENETLGAGVEAEGPPSWWAGSGHVGDLGGFSVGRGEAELRGLVLV